MADKTQYHHGDLPTALMDAVEAIVVDEGVQAVSLRKAARRVGVSHAAPAHHFGDLTGLLAAVAMRAHDRLAHDLITALESAGESATATDRIAAAGLAYMQFGAANPGVFQIMFRKDVLHDDADLESPEKRSLQVLVEEIARSLGTDDLQDPDVWDIAISLWSIVHGATAIYLNGVPDPAGSYDTVEVMHQQIGTLIVPGLEGHPRWGRQRA
ncbi:TetR/AcrR family transcriptional regulator [Euzebya tangerina]|uniref:TetR/AcrR family transcriptional regulator n=1 Tax=Euzebya tangerina TaxID=591198 RepID=UPI000E313BFF|nr:TetR/AcrR family transcriptional regulator [Euzebya tangerina]